MRRCVPALLFVAAGVPAGADVPALVTSPTVQSASADGDSFVPSISRNGRFVFFLSNARNLIADDDLSSCLRLFRHDLQTGEIKSVPANSDTMAFSVSADGRFIAFTSAADNLVADDGNAASDIFLWDVHSGSTTLVSFALTGRSPPTPLPYRNRTLSDHPLISSDATWVAFESYATNLVSNTDTNSESDVFICHLPTRNTVAISVDSTGQRAGNGRSTLAGMTPDGRYVLFVSRATDLTADELPNGVERVFVRDVTAGTTVCVEPMGSFNPVISTNGQFVAFKAASTNATDVSLLLKDIHGGELTVLAQSSRRDSSPQISEDGRYVAYEDGNTVYVWDRETNQRRAASGATNRAFGPLLSATGSHVAFLQESAPRVYQVVLRDLSLTNAALISATVAGTPSHENHELNRFALDSAGRFVAFDASDEQLVSGDLNRASDVFLRSAEDSVTRLISSATVRATASGGSIAARYGISHDGSVVIFRSDASDLALQDTNSARDVFVKNVRTGAMMSLTTGQQGERAGEGEPVISADGKFAVYSAFKGSQFQWQSGVAHMLLRRDLGTGEEIRITNLISTYDTSYVRPLSYSISSNGALVASRVRPFDSPYDGHMYLWNLETGTNQQVDVGFQGSSTHSPLISPDSTAVLFSTGTWHLRDLVRQRTILIGNDTETHPYVRWMPRASFSADSRYVVWGTRDFTVSVFDRRSETNTFVCTNCANPTISADGSWVAYETFQTSTGVRDIESQHLPTRQRTLINRNVFGTGGGNRSSIAPAISADARFIAYVSRADDLVVGDENTWADLFVHDRVQDTTIRIAAAGPTSGPRLSGDGRTVIFQSFSLNRSQDLFILKLAGSDSDNDALPDDWEAAYFGDLARDGTADFDQDGHNDLQEYVAGTDPTNSGSILRVITLTSSSTGETRLFWSAVAGKTYRVEYKSNLTDANWEPLPSLVTADSTTASLMDSKAGFSEARFYRVVTVN